MEGRKLNISPKLIGILAVILILIIGVTAWLHAGSTESSEGTELTICLDGEEVAVYQLEELMKMDSDSVHTAFTSGKGDDEEGTWTGVWMDDLLETAGISEEQYETIILSAGDGYSVAADVDEAETVLVAWEKDGETLGYYEKGGTGPMRCIFSEESFGMRCINYLVKIDCRP